MENKITVELADVGKKYGRKQLFQGLTKVIEPGQCVAVTGRNGSGKSTLLKLIAGIGRPSSGCIRVLCGSKELDNEDRLPYLGMISPEVVFYKAMTGIENALFLAKGRGLACSQAEVEAVLKNVGLAEYQHNLLSTYSTGMKQRLKFAVMQLIQPALWLLDEPSSNLDTDGKALVESGIRFALHSKATVIIATNESWEAAYASEQITLNP